MATDLDEAGIFDLLELAHRRRNPTTRFYSSTARNDQARYRALVRWAMGSRNGGTGDWHRITHGQLAAQVYGVEPTREEGVKKANSNRDSLRRLAGAGLLEWRAATSVAGETRSRGRTAAGGHFISLEYRLLPVPDRALSVSSRAPAGVAQSVQATPAHAAIAGP